MSQQQNPRRAAMESLRAISRNVATMTATWSQRQSKMIAWGQKVKLTDAEKVENDPAQWLRLATFMEAVAREAQSVAFFACEEAKAAEQRLKEST